MEMRVLGVDIGGTKVEAALVDVQRGKIEGDIQRFSSSDFLDNQSLVDKIEGLGRGGPIGVCAPGVVRGLKVFCPNIPFTLDFSALDGRVNVENDLAGASYALDRGMGKEEIRAYSLWTISTGGNGHSVIDGRHFDHELGHQTYTPHNIDFLPSNFKLPRCGCQNGVEGKVDSHLEAGFSAGGAERMAREYMLRAVDIYSNSTFVNKLLKKHNTLNKDSAFTLNDFLFDEVKKKVVKSIDAKMIYEAYRERPLEPPQSFIIPIQIQSLAQTFGNFVGHFPEVRRIYIMGSQGTHNFKEQVIPAEYMAKREAMFHPAIVFPEVRKLEIEHPGIIGSARAYMHKNR